MSEVKTYAVNCNDAWLNTKGDDISDSYVKYADYMELVVQLANAESKCRELAAENAGLKDVCDDRRTFIMNGVQLGYIEVPTVETDPALETIRIAVSPQEPTPATDAFLAEVRAQGVEMFSEKFGGGTLLSDMVKETAKEFAAQLRKGGAA